MVIPAARAAVLVELLTPVPPLHQPHHLLCVLLREIGLLREAPSLDVHRGLLPRGGGGLPSRPSAASRRALTRERIVRPTCDTSVVTTSVECADSGVRRHPETGGGDGRRHGN